MTCCRHFQLCVITLLMVAFQNSSAAILKVSYTNDEVNTTNCHDDLHIQNVINNIYKNNFDNFEKVINFATDSEDYNFTVVVIYGLYNAMVNAHHTGSPIKALTLYRKLEEIINDSDSELLSSENLNELERIREEILLRTVVPKSSNILVDNIFITSFSFEDTAVTRLLELLQINNTVFTLTIARMVEKNPWLQPIKLIPFFAKLTHDPEINVDSLLLLYDIYKFQNDEKYIYSVQLAELIKDLDFSGFIAENRKRKIDEIVSTPLQALLSGRVCFYQSYDDLDKYYIVKNLHFNKLSVIKALHSLEYQRDFLVGIKRQPLTFNFRSALFNGQPIYFRPDETEGLDGFSVDTLNIPLEDIDDMIDIDWKVRVEGEQVVLQNINSTIFLCAEKMNGYDGQLRARNEKGFSLHTENCKWYVENC